MIPDEDQRLRRTTTTTTPVHDKMNFQALQRKHSPPPFRYRIKETRFNPPEESVTVPTAPPALALGLRLFKAIELRAGQSLS